MTQTKLKNIASVQMGYSFRNRLEASHAGSTSVIQMKDLAETNIVNCRNLIKIEKKDFKSHHIAQKGDLVFRSRGRVAESAVLLDELGDVVVAAPMLRIRITKPSVILPRFLNWYISQRKAQAFLTSRAKGTFQKMISKQTLENLEVQIPEIETQKAILELSELSVQEQELLKKIAEKRDKYINARLIHLVKESSKDK